MTFVAYSVKHDRLALFSNDLDPYGETYTVEIVQRGRTFYWTKKITLEELLKELEIIGELN